jgi:hypothetical protein
MNILGQSFSRFVYAFTFSPATFGERVTAVNAARRESPTPLWGTASFPEDDLMPHVADFLNSDEHATAFAWELDPNLGLQSFDGLGAKGRWSMALPGGRELPFCIDGVQLVLFRLGIGFLVWDVCPDVERLPEGTDPLAAWLDFLHYFRRIRGGGAPALSARRKTGPDQWAPFFPFTSAPANPQAGQASRYLQDLNAPLLDHARLPDDRDQWWEEIYARGYMIPYFYLVVAADGAIDVPVLLYRLRNFFHSRQEIFPTDGDMAADHPSLLPYARNQFFVCAMEGGGFLAVDPPDTPFFRQTLRDHVRKQYYLLFLLALNQRFTLMRLHHRVATEWVAEKDPAREEPQFEGIYQELLEFDAREYFVQVMQKEHHHRCYRKWQEVFQVSVLHEQMTGQVHRMYSYLSGRRSERIEKLQELEKQRSESTQRSIVYLTFGVGVPALVCSFLGINMVPFTSKEGLHWYIAVSLVGAALVVAFTAMVLMIRRQSKTRCEADPGAGKAARPRRTGI